MEQTYIHLPIGLRRSLIGALVCTAILLACSFLPVPAKSAVTSSASGQDAVLGSYDSPNALSNGLSSAADELSRLTAATENTLTVFAVGCVRTAALTGKSFASGLQNTGSIAAGSLRRSAAYLANTTASHASTVVLSISRSATLAAKVPATLLRLAISNRVVSAVIQPSAANNTAVPMIEATGGGVTLSPALAASAVPQAAAAAQVPPANDTSASWPVHGEITTVFGEPHWPYQPTHTGIDISDGSRAGTTPVHPFKPGRVVDVIHSYSGLGNHVIVDHGSGLTSVYGHLDSISATIGQTVDKDSVLGLEGTTGASTGTHLHLEIRVNGQPVDPQLYIPGHP